jgi:hypothetical protein
LPGALKAVSPIVNQKMKAEEEAFRACAGAADFSEGIGAVFDERKPRFVGK